MVEILIVEDAKFFRNVIKSQIENSFGFNVTAVETYAEAVASLTQSDHHFDLSLLDLNLPDAPDGEIVDLVTGMGVPSIIFSGSFSEEIRDLLDTPNVIDYVLKDSPASLNYVLNTVDRYFKNKSCNVLVIDDSRVALKHMKALLEQFNFNVLTASNGQDALKIFYATPDIRLVICDYHMPDMQGVEVCKRIRAKKGRDEVCIIGVSAYGTHALSAQFIKAGASDFLVKPFLAEEFFCRVTLNMDALDRVIELDELVHTDLVTQLHNRRFLEEHFQKFRENSVSENLTLMCAYFEIDDFRQFNDHHGSDAGDAVLYTVARSMEKEMAEQSSLVIRYGGSQFCILCATPMQETFIQAAQRIHNTAINNPFVFDNSPHTIGMTACVSVAKAGETDKILTLSKQALTEAKKTQKGRFTKPSLQ